MVPGMIPNLPLGEGVAAATDEGRYRLGPAPRPTPVTASPCHSLLGEGFLSVKEKYLTNGKNHGIISRLSREKP